MRVFSNPHRNGNFEQKGGGSAVKNLPAMQEIQEMQDRSLGLEDPLEEGMAAHSSTLAWEISGTEGPGRLHPRGWKELDTT